ncbi:hypothetical protein ACP70R_044359 [Stipagrostis hirtigluma subsp. patula]
MKDVPGSPGTWGGLALRVSQVVCALASLVAMATSFGSFYTTAFCYLMSSMFVELLWGLILLCVDVYSLKTKWDLHRTGFVLCYVLGDWIFAITSSATVCSAAAVIIFLGTDIELHTIDLHMSYSRFKVSVVLGFMAWSFLAATATSNFFLLASLVQQ